MDLKSFMDEHDKKREELDAFNSENNLNRNSLLDKVNLTSDDVLICFDANALLHLFRITEKTTEEYFKSIEISKNNIFVPYQAIFEFQNNIHNYKKRFDDILNKTQNDFTKKLSNINGTIDNIFDIKDQNDKPLFRIKHKEELEAEKKYRLKLKKDFKNMYDKWISELGGNCEHFNVDSRKYENKIDKLSNLLSGKIGPPYSQIEIDYIEEFGYRMHNDNAIYPGYLDLKKDKKENNIGHDLVNGTVYHKRFGDLILWNQIKDKIEQSEGIKKQIFLITEDLKEDWVRKKSSSDSGIHPSFKKEIYDKYNAEIHIITVQEYIYLAINSNNLIVTDDTNYEVWSDFINKSHAINDAFSKSTKFNELAKSGIAFNELAKSSIAFNELAKSSIAFNELAKSSIAFNELAKSGIAFNELAKSGIAFNELAESGIAFNELAESSIYEDDDEPD